MLTCYHLARNQRFGIAKITSFFFLQFFCVARNSPCNLCRGYFVDGDWMIVLLDSWQLWRKYLTFRRLTALDMRDPVFSHTGHDRVRNFTRVEHSSSQSTSTAVRVKSSSILSWNLEFGGKFWISYSTSKLVALYYRRTTSKYVSNQTGPIW